MDYGVVQHGYLGTNGSNIKINDDGISSSDDMTNVTIVVMIMGMML